ncbi:MAG: hypothetical protein JWO85_447 [Candidatus Eremiobacteraeota bacterium]|nr:hypothetical protein [Candidatus Eremiobacteraeota bacterium]
MYVSCARLLAVSAVVTLTMTACGGGSQHATPVQLDKPAAAGDGAVLSTRSAVVPLSPAGGTFALPLGDGYRGAITMRANGVPAGSTMTLEATTTTTTSGGRTTQAAPACPNIPPIRLLNPFGFALLIEIDAFQIDVPCSVDGKLFAVGVYQLKPLPTILTVRKIGDAKGVGDELQFTPTVNELTLPPHSTQVLLISPESTTSGVPIPVVPSVTTVLTAGNTNVPTNLSFKFTSAQGASFFTSSCNNAFHGETLDPQLQGAPLVGTPSFFCHLDPGNASITFGAPLNFFIGTPKPDASVLGLDGPSEAFTCQQAPSTTTCGTPTFTIGTASATTFQNVVVGNAEDLRICAPATENTDCNQLVEPAPSRTSVPFGQGFQVLVADDPTYRANAGPWDGKFRSSLSGPCSFADSDLGGSEPPGYSDAGQHGIGPKAEFDVIPTGSGVCTITMSEDPRFITADFSNPANPVGRTVHLSITIQAQPS